MKKLLTYVLSFALIFQSAGAFAAVGSDYADNKIVPNWVIRSNNCDSRACLDMQYPIQGKQSLKLINKTPAVKGGSLTASTILQFEKGVTYRIAFVARGTKIDNARISVGSMSKRINIYGSSFGVTNFEFEYLNTAESGNVNLTFTVTGICEGLWIDNVCVSSETNDNIVPNPYFEDGEGIFDVEEQEEKKVDEQTSKKEENTSVIDVHSVDEFTADDIEASFAAVGYMPIKRKTIDIDGKITEWADDETYAHIPSKPNQKVAYTQDKLDINANVYVSYDDEFMYFAIDVEDDVHYAINSTNYWTADSIQMAITGVNAPYTGEIGICLENDRVGLFCSYTETVMNKIKVAAIRSSDRTVYEIAVPWEAEFTERPDAFRFDILVNDNDGNGRIGVVDFSGGGIHQSKDSSNYLVARIMEDNEDIYAWIEGEEKLSLEEPCNYRLYLINRGTKEHKVTVKVDEANFEKEVKIPARSGIATNMPLVFETTGQREMVVKLNYDDFSYNISKTVSVSRNKEQLLALYDEQQPLVCGYLSDIEMIIKDCKAQNIPVEYLELGASLIRKNLDWLALDYKKNDLVESEQIFGALTGIYEKTMELGEGYLNGTIKAMPVPQYVSSDLEVAGQQFIASVNNNGVIERRPVMFTGYLTWNYLMDNDIPMLKSWGTNIVHTEIRAYEILKIPDINQSWKAKDGGVSYDVDSTVTDEEANSGKYSLKINDGHQSWMNNRYKRIYQTVEAKPNTTYYFGLSAKAKEARCQWFNAGNNLSTRVFVNPSNDWKKYSGEITTGPNETSLSFLIMSENGCNDLYIDDTYLTEAGSSKNLLDDAGFESGESWENEEYSISKEYIEKIKRYFKEAEDNNVRIDLLLAIHNMPYYMDNYYDELKYTGGGFYRYNLNAEKVKDVYRECIKAVIPEICNYKSFGSVCLTNEPAFNATDLSVQDFYKDDWTEYLKKTYNNDINELNRAYGSSYQRFEDVGFESKAYAPQDYDRRDFATDVFTAWHQWVADEVKKYAPNALIHSKTMQYIYDNDYSVSRSQLGIGTDMEKFASYSDINGNDAGANIAGDSMELLFLRYDYQTSVKNAPVDNSEDHCYGGYTDAFGNVDESTSEKLTASGEAMSTRMAMWGGSMHGRGASTIWIYERDKVDARNRAYYNQLITLNPAAMYAVGTAGLDLQRLSCEVAAFQNQPKEVGILYSNTSRMYDIGHLNTVAETYYALLHNGQKVHIVTDLTPQSMQNLRMLVLPDTINIRPDMLSELKKFVENGGHLVVLDENGSISKDQHNFEHDKETVDYILNHATVYKVDVDGLLLKTPEPSELEDIMNTELSKAGINRFKIVDATTGEKVKELDYYATTYNSDLMVQVCNLSDNAEAPAEMMLLINGQPVGEFEELVTGKRLNKTFNLPGGEYAILKLDTNNRFVDTYGHWAENKITAMTDSGIISGVSETMFAPDRNITRAEFTQLLVRKLSLSGTGENYFTDLTEDDWFKDAANIAKKNGILADNGKEFNGNEFISREEMAYMVYKAVNAKPQKAGSFTDDSHISERFKEAVNAVHAKGIISGYEDGSFRPQGNLTRAEAVSVLSNL